jgi:deoxyribonuclease-4
MWRSRLPDADQVKAFRSARERFDLDPLAIHASYLVNLASVDPIIRAKSIEAFRGELERAVLIGADYLVLHPGSTRGRSAEEGIDSFVEALREAAVGFHGGRLTLLLENTAGCGDHIGRRFEELHSIRELAGQVTDLPVGYCLDTCHLLAAGFDISTQSGLRDTIRSAEELLGLEHVRLIHANDSKMLLGSKVDRHASIGKGHIGQDAFRRILTHPKLRHKPFILETPVDEKGEDRRNVEMLKSLSSRRRAKA